VFEPWPTPGRVSAAARHLAARAYYRLVALNYRTRLVARRNRTPAGTFRCYELFTRHGDDPMLAAMARECTRTGVIYDVGANVGIYALALAVGHPQRRIVAFEPSPRTVAQLETNLSQNAIGDRIDVRPIGLGEETGRRELYRSTLPELSAFEREGATRWGASVVDTVEVSVSTLDDVVAHSQKPDVVKLDVEGGGPAVLAGAGDVLETVRPTFYVELHEEGLSGDGVAEMRSLFEAADYLIDVRDGYWRCTPTERDSSADNGGGTSPLHDLEFPISPRDSHEHSSSTRDDHELSGRGEHARARRPNGRTR